MKPHQRQQEKKNQCSHAFLKLLSHSSSLSNLLELLNLTCGIIYIFLNKDRLALYSCEKLSEISNLKQEREFCFWITTCGFLFCCFGSMVRQKNITARSIRWRKVVQLTTNRIGTERETEPALGRKSTREICSYKNKDLTHSILFKGTVQRDPLPLNIAYWYPTVPAISLCILS